MTLSLALSLGAVLPSLALALLVVTAAVVAVASGFFFLRARVYERIEGSLPPAGGEASEVRALGERIEMLVGQQQLQGETQRQMLAQKIDAVGQRFDEQRLAVDGLRNEMRHEARRRDAELDEIRHQIASIQHAAPALGTPAHAAPLPLALGDGTASLAEPVTGAVPERSSFEPVSFESPSFEPVSFETPSLATPPVPVAEPAPARTVAPAPAAQPVASAPPTFEPITFDAPQMPAGVVFERVTDEPTAAVQPTDPFATAFEPVSFPPVVPVGTPSFEPPTLAVPAVEMPAPTAPLAEMPAPATDARGSSDGFAFMETFSDPFVPAPPAAMPPAPSAPPASPFDAWTVASPAPQEPAPPSDGAWVARSDRPEPAAFAAPPAAVRDPFADPEPAAEAPAAPSFPTPHGADDLTVITSIDAGVQHALYLIGVTKLDEIARWGRGDARRISAEVGVSEETIMGQWIFEAQSALFDQYARQAS